MGKITADDPSLSGFYALAMQTGLARVRHSVLTPIRFFETLAEVQGFIQAFPADSSNLQERDRRQLERVME